MTHRNQIAGSVDLATLAAPALDQQAVPGGGWRGPHVHSADGLRCVLMGQPHFKTAPTPGENPAATVARLWQQHKQQTPQHLGEGFAFALLDSRAGTVFLAVDRFARETLCYGIEGSRISFSDRADCVDGISREIDLQSIYDYVLMHCGTSPRTIFQQVRRLPPGHSLTFSQGHTQLDCYWPLRFDEDQHPDFRSASSEFRNLIRQAVERELKGHRHVGAFLSGGTDSSTIAGMLASIQPSAVDTYSIGFEAEGYDEMAYARLASKHFGTRHHEYYLTPADLRNSIVDVARHHDQPFGNSSALPAYYCAKYAKDDGCDKLLAGDGGDELFGGNSRYASQKFFNHYHALPAGLRGWLEPHCGEDNKLRAIPGLRQLLGYVRHSRAAMPERLLSSNLLQQLSAEQVFDPAFLARIDAQSPIRQMREVWGQAEAGSLINRMLAYDWRYTLAESDLPKVRGATQMAGIDVAYPLLTDELTAFSMQLPPAWKLKGYKLRWFFKESLRGFLPDEIITKKKHGFGLPFGVWAHRDAGLGKIMRDGLQSLAQRGLVRPAFVRQLLEEKLPQHPGYYGEMVWVLLALEHWLQSAAPDFRCMTD